MRRTRPVIGLLAVATILLTSCNKQGHEAPSGAIPATASDQKVLNLFWWSDFMAPDTILNLAKQTGIDPVIYPPPDQQQRLYMQTEDSPEQSRAITRLWRKFKMGQ
jgi:spermidine/putrescine-binding protein